MAQNTSVVLTVLTRFGPSAPAASPDAAAALNVFLETEISSAELLIPMNGSGILTLDRAPDVGTLTVELLNNQHEMVATNQIRLDGIGGSIAVIGFELGATASARACLSCTEPVRLTNVRGLHETHIHWSYSAQPLLPGPVELDIAMRDAVSAEQRGLVLQMAGMQQPTETRRSGDLVWVTADATVGVDSLDAARFLASQDGVKGIEVRRNGYSGRFWVPWGSE